MLQTLLGTPRPVANGIRRALHNSWRFTVFPADLASLEPLLQAKVQAALQRITQDFALDQRMVRCGEFLAAFQVMWRDALRRLKDDSVYCDDELCYLAVHVTFRPLRRNRVEVTLLITTDRRARRWAVAPAIPLPSLEQGLTEGLPSR